MWCNMPFSKMVLLILLCRAVGVTHIVESGRMGGLALVHYARFGFLVTSVEKFPLPHVTSGVRTALPTASLYDGDGAELVPRLVRRLAAEPTEARVAVILDGPKGRQARNLSWALREHASLVVLDDDDITRRGGAFQEAWPHATVRSNSRTWRQLLPLTRDREALTAPPNPKGAFDFDAKVYIQENDVASILLGDRALQ